MSALDNYNISILGICSIEDYEDLVYDITLTNFYGKKKRYSSSESSNKKIIKELIGYQLDDDDGEFIELTISEEKISLRTDYFGSHPLFYAVIDGWIVFSTDIHLIIKYFHNKIKIDLTELKQYFIFGYPALNNKTIYSGIKILSPNSVLIIQISEGIITHSVEELSDKIDIEFAENINPVDLLQEGIKARVDKFKDEPIVHLISAGYDSGILLANFHALDVDVACATTGYKNSEDVIYGRKRAERLNYPFYSSDNFFNLSENKFRILLGEYSLITGGIGPASEIITYYFNKEIASLGKIFIFGEGGEFYRNRLSTPEYIINTYFTPVKTIEKFTAYSYNPEIVMNKILKKYSDNQITEDFYLREKHPYNASRKYLLAKNCGIRINPLVNVNLLRWIYKNTKIDDRTSEIVMKRLVPHDFNLYHLYNKIETPYMKMDQFFDIYIELFIFLLKKIDLKCIGVNNITIINYLKKRKYNDRDLIFLSRILNLLNYIFLLKKNGLDILENR